MESDIEHCNFSMISAGDRTENAFYRITKNPTHHIVSHQSAAIMGENNRSNWETSILLQQRSEDQIILNADLRLPLNLYGEI